MDDIGHCGGWDDNPLFRDATPSVRGLMLGMATGVGNHATVSVADAGCCHR